jgi:hypothetical protein
MFNLVKKRDSNMGMVHNLIHPENDVKKNKINKKNAKPKELL